MRINFCIAIILVALQLPLAYASGNSVLPDDTACTVVDIKHDLNLALQLSDASRLDSAEAYLHKALKCARKLQHKPLLAKTLLELGKIEFKKVGPRDVPTRMFLESLSLYSELNDTEGIVNCNLQMGVLNFDIRNFDAAVEYFNNILKTNTKDMRMLALAYYLSALSYSELGMFDKAETRFDKTIDNILTSDSIFHLQIQTFRGKMYTNKGESAKAVELFESVLQRYSSTIEQENYAPVYAFLSRAYLQERKYSQAIKNAKNAYRISIGKGSNTIYLREAESVLHLAYYEIGNIDSAYFYLKALNLLEDSVSSKQVLQRVTQMSGQYDFQQKLKAQQAQQELKDRLAEKELERQLLIRNLLFVGFIMVGIFAFIIFRQRTNIASERDRSEKLLLNILPSEIAEELKEKGRAEARNFDKVSILFTDFVNFTQKSEKLSASELVEEINSCFEAFDHIVDKYNLEKIKTIGDAYMAAGGLPLPFEDSVKNTVMASIEMQHYINNRKNSNRPSFEMRVGIHTGPVVAGIVGVKKFQYDIWGDTVNTASRMESHGAVGKVNISQTTYELIKDNPNFDFESRGMVEVKGKGEMDMWFVSEKTKTS